MAVLPVVRMVRRLLEEQIATAPLEARHLQAGRRGIVQCLVAEHPKQLVLQRRIWSAAVGSASPARRGPARRTGDWRHLFALLILVMQTYAVALA